MPMGSPLCLSISRKPAQTRRGPAQTTRDHGPWFSRLVDDADAVAAGPGHPTEPASMPMYKSKPLWQVVNFRQFETRTPGRQIDDAAIDCLGLFSKQDLSGSGDQTSGLYPNPSSSFSHGIYKWAYKFKIHLRGHCQFRKRHRCVHCGRVKSGRWPLGAPNVRFGS